MKLEKINTNKQLLLSTADENQIFNNLNKFDFEGFSIQFYFNQLIGLEDLQNEIYINQILHSCETKIKKGLISYKNEDGLKVYCLDTPSSLFLFSIGEFQPSLYKIILECGFRKLNSINII